MYWPRLTTALLIAAHVWGPAPCGSPSVQYATEPVPDVFGWTYDDSCVIYLSEEKRKILVDPVIRCTVIVHEWGHLTGHNHSLDPDNVMYATPSTNYWRCRGR